LLRPSFRFGDAAFSRVRILRRSRHSLNVSHLPHWNNSGAAQFLTWRLAGSLPVERTADVWTSEGAKFVALDRLLDARASGPDWLGRDDVAEAVASVLLAGPSLGFYELGSWVLMPNHVHVLMRPLVELERVVRGVKATSARAANRVLGRSGALWSRDYFDRQVRDSVEEARIVRYIEGNPVKAGVVPGSGGVALFERFFARLKAAPPVK